MSCESIGRASVMGEEGREKQGKMVCLFYKLCRWVGVVSSMYCVHVLVVSCWILGEVMCVRK